MPMPSTVKKVPDLLSSLAKVRALLREQIALGVVHRERLAKRVSELMVILTECNGKANQLVDRVSPALPDLSTIPLEEEDFRYLAKVKDFTNVNGTVDTAVVIAALALERTRCLSTKSPK